MKQNQIFIALAIFAAVVWLFFKAQAKQAAQALNALLTGQPSTGSTGATTTPAPLDYANLAGSQAEILNLNYPNPYTAGNLKGPVVIALQNLLNDMIAQKYLTEGVLLVDGNYGPRTKQVHDAAIKKFAATDRSFLGLLQAWLKAGGKIALPYQPSKTGGFVPSGQLPTTTGNILGGPFWNL